MGLAIEDQLERLSNMSLPRYFSGHQAAQSSLLFANGPPSLMPYSFSHPQSFCEFVVNTDRKDAYDHRQCYTADLNARNHNCHG